MTEKKLEKIYSISDEERRLIISKNNTNIGEFSEESNSSAKQKPDVEKAWVSKILPPSNQEQDQNKGNRITVEFLLSNGHTFTDSYPIVKSYISDDNQFVKLVKNLGYELDELDDFIGETVKIQYNKEDNNWEVDYMSYFDATKRQKDVIEVKDKIFYLIIIIVGVIGLGGFLIGILYESAVVILFLFIILVVAGQLWRAKRTLS